MAFITAIDPRGKTITCSRRRWEGHILKEHAILKDRKQEVVQAIENPTEGIFQDRLKANRQCYYREIETKSSDFVYIKVVVAFDADDTGIVVTAIPRSKVHIEEKCI